MYINIFMFKPSQQYSLDIKNLSVHYVLGINKILFYWGLDLKTVLLYGTLGKTVNLKVCILNIMLHNGSPISRATHTRVSGPRGEPGLHKVLDDTRCQHKYI